MIGYSKLPSEGRSQNCRSSVTYFKRFGEDEGLADFTPSGQLKNPAVKVTLAESDAAAARLGPKITARSQPEKLLLFGKTKSFPGESRP
ncbi:hypothetical protein TSMEX_004554 [Taenia solium]|eukprot:TsM_000738900 transcript=TsM_000738900 gene=TsM_000738900